MTINFVPAIPKCHIRLTIADYTSVWAVHTENAESCCAAKKKVTLPSSIVPSELCPFLCEIELTNDFSHDNKSLYFRCDFPRN